MEGLVLIGLIIVGMVLLSPGATPPERVIYVVQPAQPPAPAQQSGGIGCLLLLALGALLVLALLPGVW